jgi:hypothetical protein
MKMLLDWEWVKIGDKSDENGEEECQDLIYIVE